MRGAVGGRSGRTSNRRRGELTCSSPPTISSRVFSIVCLTPDELCRRRSDGPPVLSCERVHLHVCAVPAERRVWLGCWSACCSVGVGLASHVRRIVPPDHQRRRATPVRSRPRRTPVQRSVLVQTPRSQTRPRPVRADLPSASPPPLSLAWSPQAERSCPGSPSSTRPARPFARRRRRLRSHSSRRRRMTVRCGTCLGDRRTTPGDDRSTTSPGMSSTSSRQS